MPLILHNKIIPSHYYLTEEFSDETIVDEWISVVGDSINNISAKTGQSPAATCSGLQQHAQCMDDARFAIIVEQDSYQTTR